MATRAKDSDRDVTCKALDAAFGEGQISTEEHRQRIAVATQAQTLGELNGLVSDLQVAALPDGPPPSLPERPRRWPALVVTAVVSAAIGVGAGMYTTRSSAPDPSAVDDGVAAVVIAPTKLFSVPGLSGLLDQMRAKFGDTTGIELTVHANNASLVRIEPSDPNVPITYPYQGGFRDGGMVPGTWRNVRIGDLGRFDPAKIVGVLRGAPQTLNVPNAGESGTVMVIRPSDDGVDITITVSERDRTGRMIVAGNGEPKEVAPAPLTTKIYDLSRMAGTRAKDTDRNDTCKLLDDALSDGQLSMEEHRERVASATTATTLSQLSALVTDLQNAKSAASKMPVLNRPEGRPWWRRWYTPVGVATALVLVGVLIGWGAYGNTNSPLDFTNDPGAKPDGVAPIVLTPPRQLQSLGGLTGLFEQMRQKFGDTTGYELNIYGDYAILTRPDPAEPRRVLRYTYQGGWSAPDDSTGSHDERLVDLAKFDIKTIIGILRGAPETLGIKASEVKNTYLFITPSKDKTAPPDTVQIDISVSGEFQNGSIYVNPDGSPISTTYPTEK